MHEEDKESNISGSRLHHSGRSFIAELATFNEMTKQPTSFSAVDKNSFQIGKKDDQQLLQRVCCIKINRKWRIKRQIFITTTVVFLIVLGILMAFIGVNYTFHIRA